MQPLPERPIYTDDDPVQVQLFQRNEQDLIRTIREARAQLDAATDHLTALYQDFPQLAAHYGSPTYYGRWVQGEQFAKALAQQLGEGL